MIIWKRILSLFLSIVVFITICLPTNVFASKDIATNTIKSDDSLLSLERLLSSQLNGLANSDETVTEQVYSLNSKSSLTDEILNDPFAYQEWKKKYLNQGLNNVFTMQALSSNYISNDFIAVQVDGEGYFTIGTTGGNPNTDLDNNRTLLYG